MRCNRQNAVVTSFWLIYVLEGPAAVPVAVPSLPVFAVSDVIAVALIRSENRINLIKLRA